MASNLPATTGGGQLTLKQRLQNPNMIAELGKAMPQHCKPERMARIAITALTRVPELQRCTPASFFECLLSLSQWGLEPDGRRAHLIPYGDKCTLIIDYKGYVELAYRSGVVKNIHADVVRDGDIFRYSSGKVVEHVPHFLRRDSSKPEKPGEVFAVYCIVELTGDTVKTEVLSREEVEGIRARSKAGRKGPWVTDWNEMAKKTAFRRASKWIPLSADIRDAMDRDDDKIIDVVPETPHVQTVEGLSALLTSQGGDEEGQQDDQGGDDGSQETGEQGEGGEAQEPTGKVDPEFGQKCRDDFSECNSLEEVNATENTLVKAARGGAEISMVAKMAEEYRKAFPVEEQPKKGKQKAFTA